MVNINQQFAERLKKTTKLLVEQYFDSLVKWLDNLNKRINIVKELFVNGGFLNVCGAIDETHVAIIRPKKDKNQYVNRHHFHSLNVLAVSKPDHYFYYVNARWPGSVADAGVLRNSSLFGCKFNYFICV